MARICVTLTAITAMSPTSCFAAAQLGVRRVVWASSETTLGLPFGPAGWRVRTPPPGWPAAGQPPRYAPVDEDHYPYPTTTYALSKVASETLAGHVAQWSGIPFVAPRFSNIFAPEDYRHVPPVWDDPHLRMWNLWGYIDVRDVAQSCRLALDAPIQGSAGFIIAAADTVMNRPSADLLREVFPGREAHPRHRRVRHPARHRPGPSGARLPASPLLARRGVGQWTCGR